MSSVTPRIVWVRASDEQLMIELDIGAKVFYAWPRLSQLSDRLRQADHVQRGNVEIIAGGMGLRWPDIDEDLSLRGLLGYHDVRSG